MSYIKMIGDKKLVANTLTYLKYKALFGRELYKDIIAYNQKIYNNSKLLEEYASSPALQDENEFIKLSPDERNEIFSKINGIEVDSDFIINFIAALIATGESPVVRSVDEITADIPLEWLDKETSEYAEIIELINCLIPNFQKKTLTAN
jgi:hypothetical protein